MSCGLNILSANTVIGARCYKVPQNTKCDLKVRDDSCAKEKRKEKVSLILRLAVHKFQCPGLNPGLSEGTFNLGFARTLVRLYNLLFAGVFLPLVTVVHAGTAQLTRQLTVSLCVVFNQLRNGTEFSLAFLQQEFPFTGVFYEVGDQASGEANDERATFGFFRMWAQEVRSHNIVCKQGIAAVSCDASPGPNCLSQCFFCFGQAWGAGSPRLLGLVLVLFL